MGKLLEWIDDKGKVWLLVLVALLIRLLNVAHHSYWLDEATEIVRALTPWPDLFFLSFGPDPPGFRLLLAPFVRLSRYELIVRFPSVLLGAGSVYLMFRWLQLAQLPRLGLIAAALLAINPIAIFYAQEASQYSLVIFLALALNVTFTQVVQRGDRRDWLWLLLATVAALFSYYGLVWLLLVWDIYLTWHLWQRRRRGEWLLWGGYHLVLVAELAFLVQFFIRTQIGGVIRTRPFATESLLDIFMTFWQQTLDGFLRFQLFSFSFSEPVWLLALMVGIVVAGMAILWQQRQQRVVVGVFWLVLILFYVATGTGYYRYGVRYGLPLLPFMLLFVAAVLWQIERQWPGLFRGLALALGLMFLFFWPNLPSMPNPMLNVPREAFRPAMQYAYERADADDVFYIYYASVSAFVAYEPDPPYQTVLSPWYRSWPLADKVAHVQESVGEAERFWFLLSHITVGEDSALLDALAQAEPAYHVVDSYYDENAAALLLVRTE